STQQPTLFPYTTLFRSDRAEGTQVLGTLGIHERREHVADRDRVQRRRDEHSEGRLGGELPHRVLRRERIGEHLRERPVVADGAREHERHPCVTRACMIPELTSPCRTAAAMPPARRIWLM